MAKIELDKYYTPDNLAEYCINKTREVLKGEKVSHIIEPSAGAGAFTNLLPKDITSSYDIEPEHESVIKQDYLLLDIPYLKNRLIIGNPPYGKGNYLSVKFFKKSYNTRRFYIFYITYFSVKQ